MSLNRTNGSLNADGFQPVVFHSHSVRPSAPDRTAARVNTSVSPRLAAASPAAGLDIELMPLNAPVQALAVSNVASEHLPASFLHSAVDAEPRPGEAIEMQVFSQPEPAAILLADLPSVEQPAASALSADVELRQEPAISLSTFIPSPDPRHAVPDLGRRPRGVGERLIATRRPKTKPAALIAHRLPKSAALRATKMPSVAAADKRVALFRLGSRGEGYTPPQLSDESEKSYKEARTLTEDIVAAALFADKRTKGVIDPSDPHFRDNLELVIDLRYGFLTFWAGKTELVTQPDGTKKRVKKMERLHMLEFFAEHHITPAQQKQFRECVEKYRALVELERGKIAWPIEVGEEPTNETADDQDSSLIMSSYNVGILPRTTMLDFASKPVTAPQGMLGKVKSVFKSPEGPTSLDTLYEIAQSAGISETLVNKRIARAEATYAQALKKVAEKMTKVQQKLDALPPKDKKRKKLQKKLFELRKFHNLLQETDRFQLYWAAVFAKEGYNKLGKAKKLKAALEGALHDQAIAAGTLSSGQKDPYLIDYAALVAGSLLRGNGYYRYRHEVGAPAVKQGGVAFMIQLMNEKASKIDFHGFGLSQKDTKKIRESALKEGAAIAGKCSATNQSEMVTFIQGQELLYPREQKPWYKRLRG